MNREDAILEVLGTLHDLIVQLGEPPERMWTTIGSQLEQSGRGPSLPNQDFIELLDTAAQHALSSGHLPHKLAPLSSRLVAFDVIIT